MTMRKTIILTIACICLAVGAYAQRGSGRLSLGAGLLYKNGLDVTYRLVGFFYMCVAGSQCPGYEESRHYLARFSDNVLFHLSLIL